MGYRSDVVMAVLFDSEDAITGFFAALRLNGLDVFASLEELPGYPLMDASWKISPLRDKTVLYMHGVSWKWYGNYPYVEAANKLLDFANQQGLPCCFYRIGEEDEDSEYQHFNDGDWLLGEYFGIDRTIRTMTGGKPVSHPTKEQEDV